MSDEQDEELVRRFLLGETGAFSTLVERHQTRVFNVALRILGDPEEARDAAQDTFLSLLRKLSQFREQAAFTTWLHRITVNACYDILRKKRRQPLLRLVGSDDDPMPDLAPPVADPAEETAGTLDVIAALREIPDEYRVVLVLADVQDLAYEEIARIVEVPIGTVKSRVHRGRLALARAMGIAPSGRAASAGEPAVTSEPSDNES